MATVQLHNFPQLEDMPKSVHLQKELSDLQYLPIYQLGLSKGWNVIVKNLMKVIMII